MVSITRINIANLTIRVWREETTVALEYEETQDELWKALRMEDIFGSLGAVDRVKTVEVTDLNGNGGVFYND